MAEPTTEPQPSSTAYPPAPWHMVGQLWLGLFKVSEPVDELRSAGLYGAAFVSYEPGSPLTYSELLVARLVPAPDGKGSRVSITDIWVDSPASVAGGRELWAIPKGLCDFELETERRGPLSTTEWSASFGRRPIASARVHRRVEGDAPDPVQGHAPGSPASRTPTARTAPPYSRARRRRCRAAGTGTSPPDGPLGWLRGARQLASFRQADFRMSFG